jgi:hypothetical protein
MKMNEKKEHDQMLPNDKYNQVLFQLHDMYSIIYYSFQHLIKVLLLMIDLMLLLFIQINR